MEHIFGAYTNEILLSLSLVVIFVSVLPAYRFFGKYGLYAITIIATVTANIECLIMNISYNRYTKRKRE